VQTPISSDLSAGLVCCEVEGHDPDDFVNRLFDKHRVVASVAPYASQYVRFGPSIVNSDADIERAIRAVRSSI